MAANKQDDQPAVAPVTPEAPPEEAKVYPVTERELDDLGRGSSDCGICFVAGAICLLVAWHYYTKTTRIIFVSLIFLITGVICLMAAWNYYFSASKIIKRIKNRKPLLPPAPRKAATESQGSPAAHPPEASPPGP